MKAANWFDNLITNQAAAQRAWPEINRSEYETWRREMVFDALQDVRYGQSFCNRFDIRDNILYYDTDQQRCDAYIQRHYLHQ